MVGAPFYLKARHERGEKLFASPLETTGAVFVVVLGISALYLLNVGELVI